MKMKKCEKCLDGRRIREIFKFAYEKAFEKGYEEGYRHCEIMFLERENDLNFVVKKKNRKKAGL